CVPDEAPCASTGPASSAEIATATAEVFTNFIHFSQVWLETSLVGDEQFGSFSAVRVEHARRQIAHVANGALAMQAARCGDRAGISGSFCESLATDRPHMRRRGTGAKPFAGGQIFVDAIGSAPLLFCRETARYYH